MKNRKSSKKSLRNSAVVELQYSDTKPLKKEGEKESLKRTNSKIIIRGDSVKQILKKEGKLNQS